MILHAFLSFLLIFVVKYLKWKDNFHCWREKKNMLRKINVNKIYKK